jgi:hypothetical protein
MTMPSFRKQRSNETRGDDMIEEGIRDRLSKIAAEATRAPIPAEVKRFAPPVHPDMVSNATRLMCDSISKICDGTAEGIDSRVNDLRLKIDEIKKSIDDFESKVHTAGSQLLQQLEAKAEDAATGADEFKTRMRSAAERLINQVQTAMVMYEDVTGKMRSSPFSNDKPPALPPPQQGGEDDPEGLATP